jgi:hypothetical protein
MAFGIHHPEVELSCHITVGGFDSRLVETLRMNQETTVNDNRQENE